MPEGLIVKALSGYYYVQPDGEPAAHTVQCRARGIFKKRGESPLVGDRVVFLVTENEEGIIDELVPRTSELIRPPVSNIQLAALVFSVMEPAFNRQLLDKFLVHIEHAGIDVVIILTKCDMIDSLPPEKAAKARSEMEDNIRLYEAIGYEVIATSASAGWGFDRVQQRLANELSVFAGQSGVGKSSLLNAMVPGITLETNQISQRLGRGKHTTRHVELIPLPQGGYIADTPGFSQLDFLELGVDQLSECFREFQPLAADCKFRGCTHIHEPGCRVKTALEAGEIASSRYDHYLIFFNEMKEKKRRY
ncbi:ribosome small subunit-dependent GTPase A [Paenibacillus sp. 481]|uniref:ribosome small subunit-dependent GTPase A n=1 Tax=Paenibacillus sp. 481 TaxID=2835869 RepID=UPI001E4C0025|nr:ribosome small subunit-dependent GTPase A [Paenibacillus sp. 481]UHA74030.1 ribosome small subunit-dependent GTPase A [Paenibacillus sp. 481]